MMMHALRSFSEDPIITGPLVCHLYEDATSVHDADFAVHKQKVHSGENEYRKRVLFLMEQSGSRPIIGQEKRIIVQSCANFQQFSRPGAKGNTFARIPEEPRCEAACALYQRKDFIEHRPVGCSPRARPQTRVRSPPVDPSWTGRCTALLAHHKTSPRRLQLGHCICSRLAEVAEQPFWESALATNASGHQAEKRQSTRHADKRRPGRKAPVLLTPHPRTRNKRQCS